MNHPETPTIARVFNPETLSIDWDLLLPTNHGIIQLSRFDGILDHNSGGLGEGKYYEWEFVLRDAPQTPGDGSGTGMVHLEQEYGAKLKLTPERILEKLNGNLYIPVLKQDDKDILAKISQLDLPPCEFRASDDAVLESKVAENRLVLNSIYGPLNIGYYDGLVSHITGDILPVSIDAYISDDYEVLVDVTSDSPGLVETYHPEQLLYLLETAQFSCYSNSQTPTGTRMHLLADGREVTEPATASLW